MRKNLFLCGAVLVAMSSCSNESVPSVDEGLEKDLVPVTLGLRMASANVEADNTRGTGTVGGTTDADNVWRYENLYVLMTSSAQSALEREDWDAGWGFTSVGGTVLKKQFDNTFFSRPQEIERDGATVWAINYTCDPNEGNNVKYYPARGASDFFAYHVDDAAKNTDANGNPVCEQEGNSIALSFDIDGSQDLLVGKADVAITGEEQGFSAKTARANIIPNIRMKHLLTRLTFTFHNGNQNTKNITIKSVSVESKHSGKMYVAYQNEPAQNVVWDDVVDRLYLKQAMTSEDAGYFEPSLTAGKCPLTDFVPVELDGVNDVNIGEALFVCPGETEYLMHVELDHNIVVGGADQTESVDVPLTLKVPGGNNTAFEAGKSYHVVATIYGLEDIKVDVDLEKWEEYGEDIEVGNDNL